MKKQNKDQMIKVYKALADPVRLNIIEYMQSLDHEVACGEVGKVVNISKSSGTYHFKLLEDAGLINTRRESREKYVTLNQKTFNKYVVGFFNNF